MTEAKQRDKTTMTRIERDTLAKLKKIATMTKRSGVQVLAVLVDEEWSRLKIAEIENAPITK